MILQTPGTMLQCQLDVDRTSHAGEARFVAHNQPGTPSDTSVIIDPCNLPGLRALSIRINDNNRLIRHKHTNNSINAFGHQSLCEKSFYPARGGEA